MAVSIQETNAPSHRVTVVSFDQSKLPCHTTAATATNQIGIVSREADSLRTLVHGLFLKKMPALPRSYANVVNCCTARIGRSRVHCGMFAAFCVTISSWVWWTATERIFGAYTGEAGKRGKRVDSKFCPEVPPRALGCTVTLRWPGECSC